VECPQRCGAFVRAVTVKSHLGSDCPLRQVTCRIGCGRADLPFKQREAHEQEVGKDRPFPNGFFNGPLTRQATYRRTDIPMDLLIDLFNRPCNGPFNRQTFQRTFQ
jgi:hypothetical protein